MIIDATDNLETRSMIDRYAKEKNIPWIYGSVEAFHGQVAFFEQSSFNDAFKINSHTPQGIAAPMVTVILVNYQLVDIIGCLSAFMST